MSNTPTHRAGIFIKAKAPGGRDYFLARFQADWNQRVEDFGFRQGAGV